MDPQNSWPRRSPYLMLSAKLTPTRYLIPNGYQAQKSEHKKGVHCVFPDLHIDPDIGIPG
ncbi:uncharacterized protein F5891DRAFT_1193870 [Suillus fuscotomentosus]|uniref:Uncharacterized protein n=1 Tax=Suillus fuscotomentosus TaxID=1912939 RepID=A0AAD4DZG3_9AGAM|nr:uncharacterized protein F5891DRAFT_1193870 [Suillus fuscotomentosus]KAG1895699.1 hypothetical protein F5891DRAFT_1193870 [Suillus fuscotomentosus]